jgi:NTE family protein
MAELGLVLTGGGARGAYQVGVLKALADLLPSGPLPFRVLTGTSAGAINTLCLASDADDFGGAVAHLERAWLSLTPEQVYRTDFPSLSTLALRWFGALAGGGGSHEAGVNHLLDAAPLRDFLLRQINVDRMPRHFRSGVLKAVGLTATHYLTNTAITFFEGAEGLKPWVRAYREGRREMLTVDHVMASSAIPVFFPPVRLDGAFYGDGCVRLTVPLSPAIHLGAERLVAVSVRHIPSDAETARVTPHDGSHEESLSVAQVSGVLLDAVFLDAIEADVERLTRINATLELIPGGRSENLKRLPALLLKPSESLGQLAVDQHRRFPAMLRYMLGGIGAGDGRGKEIFSYLAFEREYIARLIDLGLRDTLARKDEVLDFVRGGA